MNGWYWPLFWSAMLGGIGLMALGCWLNRRERRRRDAWRMPARIQLQAPHGSVWRVPPWDVHRTVFGRRQAD